MQFLRSLAPLLPVLLLSACGPAPEPVTAGTLNTAPSGSGSAAPISPPAPSASASAGGTPPVELKADFDPVALATTPASVKQLCDSHLAAADALLKRIRALKGAPPDKLTYEATLGRFDDMGSELTAAAEYPYLLA